jgi:hypothetical protein
MKIKTSEATELQLDWLVAKCLDGKVSITDERGGWLVVFQPRTRGATGGGSPFPPMFFNPSTNWAQGAPILSRERISRTIDHSGLWIAYWSDGYTEGDEGKQHMQCDRSELVAGLRCVVALKLGDEIEIPEELT